LLNTQSVALTEMGNQSTANLYYTFGFGYIVGHPGGFDIQSGATLTVQQGVNVLIRADAVVSVGGTLNIANAASVQIQDVNDGVNEGIFVNNGGALTATSTNFTISGANGNDVSLIQANSGGHFSATDCIFGWNAVTLGPSSNDTVQFCGFLSQFNVNSTAALNIVSNDFTNVGTQGVVATGGASDQINMEFNYWGTIDPNQIATKILDHTADHTRPTVNYVPFLNALPPYKLAISGLGPVAAGTATNIKVTVDDMYGNPVPSYTGTVQFSSSDSSAVLPNPYTFTSADQGVHPFSVTFETAGVQKLFVADSTNSALSGQGSVTVSPASASHLSLTNVPSTATAGTEAFVTVTMTDPFGNIATGYTGTVHWADPGAQVPADYTFTATDAGTHTFPITFITAGTQTLSVTDTTNGNLSNQASVTVNPAAAAKFILSAPTNTTANFPFNVSVLVEDAFNNTATGYTGTVRFTSTDANATLPAKYTFVAGDAGQHTFAVIFKNVGLQSVTATDTALSSVTGSATVNSTGKFSVSAPATANSGAAFSITVTALNGLGATATNYTGTILFSSSDGSAVLPNSYTFTAADQGVHVFTSGVTLYLAGKQTVVVTDSINAPSAGTASITVTAGTATHLRVTTPALRVAGAPFPVTITALDASNNVVPTYTGTVHFTSTDGQATLPADYVFTPSNNGTVTLAAVFNTAGTQVLTATDTTTASIVGKASVTVSPAVLSHFLVVAQATDAAGGGFNVTVTAQDRFNNTETGYTGTAHFTSSDPNAILALDYNFTAADAGVHTFTGVTLQTAGSQTVAVNDTVFKGIKGLATVLVTPLTATQLSVTLPPTTTAGTPFVFKVTAQDQYGNTAVTYRGTVGFSSSDTRAFVPANYVFKSTDQGVASFAAFLVTAGTETITATDQGNSSIAGMGSTNTIASVATALVLSAPSTATAGTALTVTVTAYDTFGNVATGYRGTVHFTSTDPQAGLPLDRAFTAADQGIHSFSIKLKTAGNQAVTVTDKNTAALTSTASIAVSPNATTHFGVVLPTSSTAGTALTMTVSALDAYGNVTPSYTGTVQFTSTDGQVTLPGSYAFQAGDNGSHTFAGGVTLKTAGNQKVTATDTVSSAETGTATVAVQAAAIDHFLVTAPPNCVAGSTLTIKVTAQDPYNNTVTGYTGTIQFTSTDTQASLPANYTFAASDNGVHTFSNAVVLKTAGKQTVAATDTATSSLIGSALVSVKAAPATQFGITAPATTKSGVAFNIIVSALDQFGNIDFGYTGTVTFTSTDTKAKLPADYTFTAGKEKISFTVTLFTTGSQTITITDKANSSITGNAAVSVTSPAPNLLALLPGNAKRRLIDSVFESDAPF
jgi:hypothetical protein